MVKPEAISLEEARVWAEGSQRGIEKAEAGLAAFEEEHGETLEAINIEFEDAYNHPLVKTHDKKIRKVSKRVGEFKGYWADAHPVGDTKPSRDFGWADPILNLPKEGWRSYDCKPRTVDYVGPENYDEFIERADIADSIGQAAMMLHAHDGQPVVAIASYPKRITFEADPKPSGSRRKGYSDGRVDVNKTRVTVGHVGQSSDTPNLIVQSIQPTEKNERPFHPVRLQLADTVRGIVSAYGIGDEVIPPCRSSKFGRPKLLPFGRSRNFHGLTMGELQDSSPLIIDAPHSTAANYTFPETVTLHRPQQSTAGHGPGTQELTIMRDKYTPNYVATITDGTSEISVPAPRHDTLWLVGEKAIELCLASTLNEHMTAQEKSRGTDKALALITLELIERAREAGSREVAA